MGEGDDYLVVEIELKNGVTTELNITFNVTVTNGEAQSEFS